jgi:hypothetical protein
MRFVWQFPWRVAVVLVVLSIALRVISAVV